MRRQKDSCLHFSSGRLHHAAGWPGHYYYERYEGPDLDAAAGHSDHLSDHGGPVPEPFESLHRHGHGASGLCRRFPGAAHRQLYREYCRHDRFDHAYGRSRQQRHRTGGLHEPAA